MSNQNKITTERNQKIVLELAALPGNDACADCKARNPRWASHNLGIFLCVGCASIHRKIGTHVTKVKSLTMDSWTKDQVENMKANGNTKSNQFYNPNEARNPPPSNYEDTERDSELEQYIRAKYEFKRFIDKAAIVASKLGPSRSASSVVPLSRSKSTPLSPIAQTSTPQATADSTTSARSAQQPPRSATAIPPLTQASSSQQPFRSSTLPASQSQPLLQASGQTGQQNGVWSDLVSLQATSVGSSLPLQYQPTPSFSATPQFSSYPNMMNSMPNSSLAPTGYQHAMATGVGGQSSLQQMSYTPNLGFLQPHQQQQSQFGGQQMFSSQLTTLHSPMAQPNPQTPYFQPNSQPQQQAPFLSGASPSPAFLSQSPQLPLQTQPGYFSTTPQPYMQQTNHMMSPTPPGMQMMSSPPPMHQMQMQMQQQQQQQQPQQNNNQQGSFFSQMMPGGASGGGGGGGGGGGFGNSWQQPQWGRM